jgi:sodium-dependent dicarboxylate transporter 2/3/5
MRLEATQRVPTHAGQMTGSGRASGIQSAGMMAGVVLLLLSHVLPPPEPITSVGMGRAGLLVFAIIWWVCAPVPLAVTTLAALALGVGTGVLTLNEAFAANTSWIMWFLIGAFGLSTALEVNGFNRRFALWFVNLRWLRGRPYALLFMFLASAALMSALMSNTVVVVVWLSLATTIYRSLALRPSDTFAEVNTLGLAWLANIGGIMTPIGTPGNAIAIGLIAAAVGPTIGFVSWTLIGGFAGAILIASTLVVIRYVMRPDISAIIGDNARDLLGRQQEALGAAKPSEILAVVWFGVAILLWFVPDLLRLVFSAGAVPPLLNNLGLVVPALLVAVAMCMTPVNQPGRTRVLTWDEWSKGVDWGMVLFIGGVLALGTAVGAPESGVSEYLQQRLEPRVTGLPEYLFVFALLLAVMMATNVMSNLVTTAVFMPLGLTLSLSLGIGNPVAFGVLLGIGPSLSYALPSGTTTNAIVAGSGWLRIGLMVRYGVPLMILHAVIMTICVYPFAKVVLPYP